MPQVVIIGFLSLLVLCMVPLMGSTISGGHLHHGASSSCATCMESIPPPLVTFLLTVLGFVTTMLLVLPALVASRSPFHPPRLSS